MPELPEVETVVRQLAPLIAGRRVQSIRIFDAKLAAAARADLAGRAVTSVTRLGKRIVIALGGPGGPRVRAGSREARESREPLWLAVHLRMTGRLVYRDRDRDRDRGAPAANAVPRAVVELDRGRVEFWDTRRFGTLEWIDPERAAAAEGIDPTGPAFTVEALRALLRGTRQPLKTWLLRQDRVCGLGNIYASEILHRARLSPFRAGGSLSRAEAARLHAATRQVLDAAIRNCGTTFSDFQDAHGVTGRYQQYLRVYDRAGEPCLACGTPIRRQVQQQRSTYWCPGCLKKEKAGASPA